MKYLILILLTLSLNASVFLEKTQANNGHSLIRISNDTPSTQYCWVIYDNGYGHFDFYVEPYSVSRWYYEPQGYYEWRCQ